MGQRVSIIGDGKGEKNTHQSTEYCTANVFSVYVYIYIDECTPMCKTCTDGSVLKGPPPPAMIIQTTGSEKLCGYGVWLCEDPEGARQNQSKSKMAISLLMA